MIPAARGRTRAAACDADTQRLPKRVGLATALASFADLPRQRVAAWMAVSGYVAKRHEQFGIPRDRLFVVPPVVDVAANEDINDGSRAPRTIIYVGPGPEGGHKGRSVLLDAFKRISDVDGRLVLVGGRDRITQPNVDDLGYLDGEQVAECFAAATVAVVPSIWPDPSPTVTLEAMASGAAVVGSAIGGLPEILEDGRAGVLVPPGDADALARALRQLLLDQQTRDRLRQAGRVRAKRYSANVVMPEIERCYEKALTAG